MKITIHVRLLVPSEHIRYGGENKIVAERTIIKEADQDFLDKLLNGFSRIEIENGWFVSNLTYDKEKNQFNAKGHMQKWSEGYVQDLEKSGWKIHRENLLYHGLSL
jgi:hypothetical protein